MLTLYGYYRSSAAYRVRIALNLKGLAYESISIDLKEGAHRGSDFLAVNPHGRVPVLDADGLVIKQSAAILDYLDRTQPAPAFLPAGDANRAKALQFANMIGSDTHPLNNLSVLKYLKADLGLDQSGVTSWYHHWIRVNFAALEAELSALAPETAFTFGDAPGLFEIYLVPQVYNARRFDVDLSDFPLLVALDAACQGHPAFYAAHPHRQPDTPESLR